MTDHPEPKIRLALEDDKAQGLVARITVDYPSRLNVLNTKMTGLLIEAFENVSLREDLRAVVLTGSGERAFIGGADINEFAGLDPPAAEVFITRIHKLCQAIRDCPVPVIARIQGYCLGAGLEVAASCDLRVATHDSVFGMPEVKVGVPSVIEAALLPRLIGWGRTNELLLTGENIRAEEAAAWGLIERAVPAEDLDAKVASWLSSILEAAPRAVRLQKDLIRRWEELPLKESIEQGIETFRRAFETGEPAVYTRPFLERKKKR